MANSVCYWKGVVRVKATVTLFAVLVCIFGLLATDPTQAAPNLCTSQSRNIPRPSSTWQPDNSPCGERSIPESKRTGGRNLRLECASASDHYIRRPYPLKEEHFDQIWNLEVLEKWDEIQKYRQEIEPATKWSGKITYETLEVWTWTDCVFGYDFVCPEEAVTKTRTVTDSDGNTHTETYVEYEERPCWHDEDYTESRFCSHENMTYSAHFKRPSLSEWNTNSSGYYSEIPNKYDLLPGEYEDIQIYNTGSSFWNGGSSTEMDPDVKVGNQWNNYSTTERITEGVSRPSNTVQCLYNHDYHMDVQIDTIGRIVRRTPNAFKIPVDEYGEEIAPFSSYETEVENLNGELKDVFIKPTEIALTDTSSVIIDSLSRIARKMTAAIEQRKREAGQGSNFLSEEDLESKKKNTGFWKDTHVQLVLYEENSAIERDIRKTKRYTTRGAESIEFQDDQSRDQYRINLDDFYFSAAPEFIEWALSSKTKLNPGKKYRFEVRMFQEGVPFYKQDGFFGTPWSEPLELSFDRPKSFDKRSSLTRNRNWRQSPLWRKFYTRPF